MYAIHAITDCNKKNIENLHEIRNLPEVREQMYSRNVIDYDVHIEWCQRRCESHGVSDASYLVFSNTSVVGFFRFWFDEERLAGNWGMYTDTRRNPGALGVFCELNAISYFFQSRFNLSNQLIAEVRSENPIQSLHQKIGFVQESQEDGMIIFRLCYDEFLRRRGRFDKIIDKRLTSQC
jgi:hypothetical protein